MFSQLSIPIQNVSVLSCIMGNPLATIQNDVGLSSRKHTGEILLREV